MIFLKVTEQWSDQPGKKLWSPPLRATLKSPADLNPFLLRDSPAGKLDRYACSHSGTQLLKCSFKYKITSELDEEMADT